MKIKDQNVPVETHKTQKDTVTDQMRKKIIVRGLGLQKIYYI